MNLAKYSFPKLKSLSLAGMIPSIAVVPNRPESFLMFHGKSGLGTNTILFWQIRVISDKTKVSNLHEFLSNSNYKHRTIKPSKCYPKRPIKTIQIPTFHSSNLPSNLPKNLPASLGLSPRSSSSPLLSNKISGTSSAPASLGGLGLSWDGSEVARNFRNFRCFLGIKRPERLVISWRCA